MRKCCGVRATALAGRSSLSPDIRHLDLDRDLAAVALHGHRHPLSHPDGERMAVLTPITRPAESRSGPPELPGLMAASVWITLVISRPPLVGRRRFSALMMPVVRD